LKLILSILFVSLLACRGGRNVEPIVAPAQNPSSSIGPGDYIQLSKFKCRGTCQVYELRVSADGEVKLNSREYMDRIGSFKIRIPTREAASLIAGAKEVMWEMNERYYPNVSDYQESSVELKVGAESKTVFGRHQVPEAYQEVLDKLEELLKRTDWEPEK
jgi:hypothetical protein